MPRIRAAGVTYANEWEAAEAARAAEAADTGPSDAELQAEALEAAGWVKDPGSNWWTGPDGARANGRARALEAAGL